MTEDPVAGAADRESPLWAAALLVAIVVGSYAALPGIIRAFGRAGRLETVESGVYLLTLVGFPAAVLVVAYVVPSLFGPRAATAAKRALVALLLLLGLLLATRADWADVAASVAASAATIVVLSPELVRQAFARADRTARARLPGILAVGTAAWMCAGSLVSWTSWSEWFFGSGTRGLILLVTFAVVAAVFRHSVYEAQAPDPRRSGLQSGAVTAVAAIVMLLLSWRTTPAMEWYHWQAYVGPMEGLRQGGWLLWNTPAQYGIIPVVVPASLPGDGWQSFYLFQAVCNSVVAFMLYFTIRGVSASGASGVVAAALASATLFFRPRTETLLLPGQMTPSGGPVRFLVCFALLGFLLFYFQRNRERLSAGGPDTRFALTGTSIWLVSVLWAFEVAVYCTAIWFPAYALHLMQAAARLRSAGGSRGAIVRRTIAYGFLPVAALAGVVLLVVLGYLLTLGHAPDPMGYLEYALQYGGGFRTLEIDPAGPVWFLVFLFALVSTSLAVVLRRSAARSELLVVAGAWGGIWAVSSYFVSRSHPANLLSIAPFVIFAAIVACRAVASRSAPGFDLLARASLAPIASVAIALVLSHPDFVRNISVRQLSYRSFAEQVPLMEPSLNRLLLQAGATPDDPVVQIADGRMMLAAWPPEKPGEPRRASPYSWLPKQYETFGTLPKERRETYIRRNAEVLSMSGWLVDSKPGDPAYQPQIEELRQTHRETRRYENDRWIVVWYELKR